MKWNEIDFKVQEAEKANGIKSTMAIHASQFSKVAECGSLCKKEANINFMIQLKERLEASWNDILKQWWKLISNI